ncbi:MAG: hypothetical protein ACOYOV_10460 [Bacteroidales bacterium]
MSLISKSEIKQLAFISSFEETELKDEIISTAITKYIIPAVTPAVYNLLIEYPETYRELIETYIKPCLAFYVKYLHLNQLVLESTSYIPLEYQDSKAKLKEVATEILTIAEQKKNDLSEYIKANYIPIPTSNNKLISGFLI